MPKRWIENTNNEGLVVHRIRVVILNDILIIQSSTDPTEDRDDDPMDTGIGITGSGLNQYGMRNLAVWAQDTIGHGIVKAVDELIAECYPA